MGCDIHSVAQVYADGRWQTVRHRVCDDGRDYDTFAVYAGVRNIGGWKPISEPRGLPAGFYMWRGEHNGTWMGDHDRSWVTLAELNAKWDEVSNQVDTDSDDLFVMRKQMAELKYLAQKYGVSDQNVRLVFGFDS